MFAISLLRHDWKRSKEVRNRSESAHRALLGAVAFDFVDVALHFGEIAAATGVSEHLELGMSYGIGCAVASSICAIAGERSVSKKEES